MADRFFVERVKYLKDGTIKKSEQMEYATEKAAEKKFFKNVSDDMDDETINASFNVILNSIGALIEKKFWKNANVDIPEHYFVYRIKRLTDDTFKKSEVMDYETLRETASKVFKNKGDDIADETLNGSVSVALDNEGNIASLYNGEKLREVWDINNIIPPEPDPVD